MATAAQVTVVFNAWRDTRPRPGFCRLTNARRKLIRARLAEYTVDDLLALIKYATEADEPGPTWWRGGNPQEQEYLDMVHLFRVTKVPGRVEAALMWREDQDTATDDEANGLDLGVFGALRGAR